MFDRLKKREITGKMEKKPVRENTYNSLKKREIDGKRKIIKEEPSDEKNKIIRRKS